MIFQSIRRLAIFYRKKMFLKTQLKTKKRLFIFGIIPKYKSVFNQYIH